MLLTCHISAHNCISRTCPWTCETPQTTTDVSGLTLDCVDDTVAIFYQLFEEFTRPFQLDFIWFESLSEVWTVQIAIAELQRRLPHLLLLDGGLSTAETMCLEWATQPRHDYCRTSICAPFWRFSALICPEQSRVTARSTHGAKDRTASFS